LLAGDHLFVSKFSYGYSRNSLPFRWNLFSGRILFRQPQRGDVVVFKVPRDPSIDYIKRLIGLPGDKIQMRGGTLYINDAPVPKRRVASFIDVEYGQRVRIVRFEETLPNGVKYFVLDSADTYQDNTAIYRVPERHYFAMGDHRDNSTDSRDLQSVGYIPEENLVGRAEWISISFDSDPSIKPSLGTSTVRSERFGLSISP
ncbi:MAG: signal peptidase I, partial [Hyphomicrobiaceae bacterium]